MRDLWEQKTVRGWPFENSFRAPTGRTTNSTPLVHFNTTYKLSPSSTEDTLHLHYKYQQTNAVWQSNSYVLLELRHTHKCTVEL